MAAIRFASLLVLRQEALWRPITKAMTPLNGSKPEGVARRFKPWTSKVLLLAVLVILILGLRLYLSVWVLHYVNQKINENGVYSGSIENVDLHLWRGAYVIRNITIYKNSGKV